MCNKSSANWTKRIPRKKTLRDGWWVVVGRDHISSWCGGIRSMLITLPTNKHLYTWICVSLMMPWKKAFLVHRFFPTWPCSYSPPSRCCRITVRRRTMRGAKNPPPPRDKWKQASGERLFSYIIDGIELIIFAGGFKKASGRIRRWVGGI